jgi:hypothetical protein
MRYRPSRLYRKTSYSLLFAILHVRKNSKTGEPKHLKETGAKFHDISTWNKRDSICKNVASWILTSSAYEIPII